MKYESAVKAIYHIFGEQAWKDNGVQTVPSNYINVKTVKEFVRINVITGGYGLNLKSLNGQLIADIFTESNKGPLRYNQIADMLDEFLVGKYLRTPYGTIQLFNSAMTNLGIDSDNKALFRSHYSINFNFNGVM